MKYNIDFDGNKTFTDMYGLYIVYFFLLRGGGGGGGGWRQITASFTCVFLCIKAWWMRGKEY